MDNHVGSKESASYPWPRRILNGVLIGLIVSLTAGWIYENIAEARDRRFNAMPGKLVQLDGRRMHIDCTGVGSPAVILDSGLGDSYVSWHKVQPEIAKLTTTCSYDRAGLGYSDASNQPRTSKEIATELHTLLRSAGVTPPYVLVGHSMGGFDVRLYASTYPEQVAGMVLVDSSHPDQDNRLPAELRSMQGSWQREAQFLAYTMPFGVPRLLGFCDPDPVSRAAECNAHSAREALAEMKAFPQSAAEAATTGPFGSLPLAVLSHDPDKPSSELPPDLAKPTNEAWEKMQEALARLSTRGTQTIARNSAHYIQIDRPDVVIDAVQAIVTQARQNSAAVPPAVR
jgi:pimeloyl-ACP methyl ester carboxylesterase